MLDIFCFIIFVSMTLIFLYLCYGICCCKNDQITVGHDGVKVKLHVGFKFQLLEKVFPIGQYNIQCKQESQRPLLTVYDKKNTKVFDYQLDYAFTNSYVSDIISALDKYHSSPYISQKENLCETGLKGRVRKVTHYYVDNIHGSFKKAEKIYEAVYNENGKLTEEKNFYASGVVVNSEYYFYNSSGTFVGGKCQSLYVSLNGFQLESYEYESCSCKFDEKGNLAEKKCFLYDGTVYLIVRYAYTDDNKLSSEKWTDEKGAPIEDSFYNDKGKEEKVLVYEDGELQTTWRNQYDEHGNLVSAESTDMQGVKIHSDVSEYDATNNIVSWRSYENGTLCEEKIYTNNYLGHCIREVHTCYSDSMPCETVTVYNTDEYGNFLSAMIYENGKQIGAEFRSYEYYD